MSKEEFMIGNSLVSNVNGNFADNDALMDKTILQFLNMG